MVSPRSSFHHFALTWPGTRLPLPPLRRDLARQPALQLAAERDGRMPYIGERPPRLDPRIDVHAAVPGRLGKPTPAQLVEHLAGHARDSHRVVEVGARLRVEVDAQLV